MPDDYTLEPPIKVEGRFAITEFERRAALRRRSQTTISVPPYTLCDARTTDPELEDFPARNIATQGARPDTVRAEELKGWRTWWGRRFRRIPDHISDAVGLFVHTK